ncbi:unnamed protein product, partial [Laminaria digitata]
AESERQVLTVLTFFLFGAVIVPEVIAHFTPMVFLYALLSLTVVRMLPVAISLIGSRLRFPTWVFLGWFGPRGLASILFALLVLGESETVRADELMAIVTATVLLSVFLHGMTAAPAARWYGRIAQRMGDSEEAEPIHEMRPRFRVH